MTILSHRIDTPIAIVERTASDLVEVRVKPGSTLSVAGITSILQARKQLSSGQRMRALFVFANEDTDFDMAMITADHYGGAKAEDFTRAVAWVAHNAHNERFCELYFAYFPSPVPSAIFMTEEAARGWLEGK